MYIIGTSANASISNKNFLKGANQFTSTISYGLELNQNDNPSTSYLKRFYLFSQNLGINFRLTFPKFMLPLNPNAISQNAMPRTFLNLGVNSMRRYDNFTLLSINSSFGYTWKESQTKTWTVKPAFINTLHLRDLSPKFIDRMDSFPAIKNSFQETFVEGESVEFVINTEGKSRNKYAYMKLALEEAKLTQNELNFNHAQYVRLDFDVKQYFLRRNAQLAIHFNGGIGIPYGNATVLPYIKQYFVGGAYSIRGWRPRVLGPGSYYDSARQNSLDNLFLDQAGDIKLELSTEYRFAIIKLFSGGIALNGAVFTDMGNIWLTRKDVTLPGANIDISRFYQDIALSSGAGIRADFGGFLVLRFDWAIPLKKPYGWVINQIDLGDGDWRRKNLNFSLAIGYPF
jgi:outer membrane protein insertion porin family